MDHRQTNKGKEARTHVAMLEIPERVYEDCHVKLERATVKSHETTMVTIPIGGVPFRQYDPKLIRVRSRFEGVSTPRNEWNSLLRTKTALEQQSSRTRTFKREEEKSRHHPRGANANMGIYVPIMHMMQGKNGARANPSTVLRADTISETAKQRGESFTTVETGDTRAISKPEKKIKKEM